MDTLLASISSLGDWNVLHVALFALLVVVFAWWEFYAKPCRDSLRAIELALKAAPWMRSQAPTGVRRSA